MQTVVIVVHLMIVVVLIGTVLLQKSEGGGLGMGGGAGFMSSRGTANLLTRTTAVLAAVFFVLSLALALLNRGTTGVGRSILEQPAPTLPVAPAPTEPTKPSGPSVPTTE